MKLVVIESPFKSAAFLLPNGHVVHLSEEDNVRYARACAHDCFMRGEAPWASHLLYPQPGILRDDVPKERELGIAAGIMWGACAERCVVYIDRGITEGMRKYGIPGAEGRKQPVEYRRLGGEWTIDGLAELSVGELLVLGVLASAAQSA